MNEIDPPAVVSMQCGPECRHAHGLPLAMGDWVWCDQLGAPRAIGARARPCHTYVARTALEADAEARRQHAQSTAPWPTR